jgi:hypothetical protein
MRGFKQYMLSEIRYLLLDEPVELKISEPVSVGGRYAFHTQTKSIDSIDMRYEFYIPNSAQISNDLFIQQLPAHVRTKETQILVSEGGPRMVGGKFYIAEADPALLRKALSDKKAYVDVDKRQLVAELGAKSVIECTVNPLDAYRIPVDKVTNHETGESMVRDGWEQLRMFTWWDFTTCIGIDGGFAKKSCRLEFHETKEKSR